MQTELDPRFSRTSPTSESFNGHHIKGYIAVERFGMTKRRMCHIFKVGRKHFPENAIDEARQWMMAMDRPQEKPQ